MDEINQNIPHNSLLVEAVVIWTGKNNSIFPCRDDAAVQKAFGVDVAPLLISKLVQLKSDFYRSDACYIADGLINIGEKATLDFRERHPELDSEISEVFAWCYTYDNR
jgi:hypothetical protein